MKRDPIRDAVVQIVTAYVSNHVVEVERLPALVTSILQALSTRPMSPEVPRIEVKRPYRKRVSPVAEQEADPSPSGSGEEGQAQTKGEPTPVRRGRRSTRALVEQQAEIPALVAAVGAALQPLPDALPQNVITKRSYRRRAIEREAEVPPPDAEYAEAPPIIESEPEPRPRGRRSTRALVEQQAEVVVEEGVRITRLPPVVKRKRG